MMCPCYKCDSRHLGCHSGCEAYKGYRDAIEAANKRREQDEAVSDYNERKYRLLRKIARQGNERRKKGE